MPEKKSIKFEQKKPEQIVMAASKKREQLFAEIVAVKNRARLLDYADRIFEHSVEDGLVLANRLNLSPTELTNIVTAPGFMIKHQDICRHLGFDVLTDVGLNAIKGKPDKQRLALQIEKYSDDLEEARASDDWEQFIEAIQKQRDRLGSNRMIAEIDDYYAPLLKTRKFEPRTSPNRYPTGEVRQGHQGEIRHLKSAEELADQTLGQYELLLRPAYYTWTIKEILNKYLKDHELPGEPQELAGNYFVTDYSGFFTVKEVIESECERLGIPFNEIESRLNTAKYVSITANIKGAEAEKGIVKKLNKSLEERGQKVELKDGRYEVVEIEKKEEEEQVESDGWDEIREFELSDIDLDDDSPINEMLILSNAKKKIKINGKIFGLYFVNNKYIVCYLMHDGSIAPITKALERFAKLPESFDIEDGKVIMHLPPLKRTIIDLDIDKIRTLEKLEKKRQENIIVAKRGELTFVFEDKDKLDNFVEFELFNKNLKVMKVFHVGNPSWEEQFIEIDGKKVGGVSWTAMMTVTRVEYHKTEKELIVFGYRDSGDMSIQKETGHVVRINDIWAKELGWEKVEKKESDFAEFENKSLNYLEQLMYNGGNMELIAEGLVGCESDRAWKLREQLIKNKYEASVVQGLAGCESARAWSLRDDTLKHNRVGKSYLIRSLIGLDSDRAWQMREQLIEAGSNISFIVANLAGCDSDRAWKMREQLIADGGLDNEVIQSLIGMESERAWELRYKLNADSRYLIWSLTGCDSDLAWNLREEILDLNQKSNLYYIAYSLAGCDSDLAWAMRNDLRRKGGVEVFLASLTGLNSERAWQVRDEYLITSNADEVGDSLIGSWKTYPWQLMAKAKKGGKKELTDVEAGTLRLLNLLHHPTLEGIYQNLGGIKSEIEANQIKKGVWRDAIANSPIISNFLTKVIGTQPKPFLETMPAKRDRSLDQVFAEQLVFKIFPEIKEAKERKAWNGFPGYSGLESGQPERSQPSPQDYLLPNAESGMIGGGLEGLSDDREIMEFRDQVGGVIVTDIYSRYNPDTKRWSKNNIALDAPLSEPIIETTATIPNVGNLQQVSLPKLLEARIIPERVKGFAADGREFDLKIEVNKSGEVKVVDKPKEVEKIVYSLSISVAPEPMEDLSQRDYNAYKQKIEVVNGRDLTTELAGLPEDLELEVLEIVKDKNPKIQIEAIERLVRDLGYYDSNNQEVSRLKAGKSLEEQMYIMEQRLEELKQKNPGSTEYDGKRFAGVCADFAQLTAILLRRAGFASGVISGFGGVDKKVLMKNAHATSFVLWPDKDGHNRIISIDGTPDGVDGISLPSLAEREAEVAGKEKELSNLAAKEIQKIIEGLNKLDAETIRKMSNGELERTLNSILKYQVKESHLAIIERLFDYYWYTPIHKLDLVNPYQRGEAMIELAGAVDRQRKRLPGQSEQEEIPAGNKLMQVMRDFLGRFEVAGVSEDKYAAITLMEKIVELVQNDLTDIEKKSAYAVIAYLKAKNILGDKK